MPSHILENARLILAPRCAALLAGLDNQIDVLVRIQAPQAPGDAGGERPPYGIALVIDRSGSMAGRPLDEARRCAAFVVDRLRADDSIALVKFDKRVSTLLPAKPKADGHALKQAIESIQAGGTTNLHGGWRAGAESLLDQASVGLRRVILLSDGCANEGLIDSAAIAEQCRELAAAGVSTSTYGLGDHFNEDLMVGMAQAGQGNQYYGDTADDLMEPFQEEFDLLANLALQGLMLQATTVPGASVEVLNPLVGSASDGWRLPDLAWSSEAWAVLRVRLPKGFVPAEGQSSCCLQVLISGLDLDGNCVLFPLQQLSLPSLNPAALPSAEEDQLVVRRLAELDAAEVLTRTRQAASQEDWHSVDRLLAEAEEKFAGNDWLASVLATIRTVAASRSRQRFMKEALYSSTNFGFRLSELDESAAMAESGKASYLRRKTLRGKTEFDQA